MLTLISGTSRPSSNTRKVVAFLETVYAELGQPTQVLDLQELPAELFSSASYASKPTSFQPFIDQVLGASGLVVVTPEYNGSFPGVLKYFIDMLPFPKSFERRPVCFVGVAAGDWGALRSVEQLQGIFGYRNAYVYPERVFIRNCSNVIDANRQITDASLTKRLRDQAAGYAKFVASLQG